mgnify:CR=1 FL=1|nr:MAG TPA: STRUCTURAL MAINTENANCE OF CHROMOSOMES PROTEIN [Caudoviricetes sp.]
MQITYFRLKGYVRVLNGMGLNEIIIPFHEFKNRIILIQGENGCAKSTIISALSPNPDSSDSFCNNSNYNGFLESSPAEKEIHYINNNGNGTVDKYCILIRSELSGERRTTKAYISKNGIELNPSGNVTSFKEIRDSLFGIDPVYLDLSSMSSENRGIVDMIPSERRKYMSTYIGSLDTYNNIFKVLSKKTSNLKSYINTLQSKLYELGNANELTLKISQSDAELSNLRIQRDEYIKSLAVAESLLRCADPENKMIGVYSSMLKRIDDIDSKMNQLQSQIDVLSTGFDLSRLQDTKLELETSLTKHNSLLVQAQSEIASYIKINESINERLVSDRNSLQNFSSIKVQSNIEESISNLENELSMYRKNVTDSDLAILETLSLDELNELRSVVYPSIEREFSTIQQSEMYSESVECIKTDNLSEVHSNVYKHNNKMIEISSLINKLESEYESLLRDKKILSAFTTMRPKSCKNDACIYIERYVQLQNSFGGDGGIDSKIKECEENLAYNKNLLDRETKAAEQYAEIYRVASIIDSSMDLLRRKQLTIDKIPELKCIFENLNSLLDHISISSKLPGIEIITSMIEKKHISIEIDRVASILKELQSDLKIYKVNSTIVDTLNLSISKLESERISNENKISELSSQQTQIKKIIEQVNARLRNLKELISLCEDKNALLQDKDKLKKEFALIKDSLKLVRDKTEMISRLKSNIESLDNHINPLNDFINRMKCNLDNIHSYQKELSESITSYDKISFIKDACNPGNGIGIQSEYVKRYMNDIIIDCNRLLGYMFNGTIRLNVPTINEKQFSVPFIGPNGIIVPDISNGSTAQKCMIGLVFSCIAMMKSSSKYNIPRFDEIDGGLDHQNRIMFINVLNQILDFMHCEQCIICSHNTEFDAQSTTRLICSRNGIVIEQ